MAISNFIPAVWSETLAKALDKQYVAVRNCNREFEGEIKNMGDSVKINSIGKISVFDYTKNTDMTEPESLEESSITLTIDHAKAFNFQIDDVDKTQARNNLLQAAMHEAAAAIADDADSYIFSLYSEIPSENTITKTSVTADNITDLIVSARERLMNNNVNSNTETVLEVSPALASLILKAKILQDTYNRESLINGYMGNFIGFEVYVSNNITKVETSTYKCLARTKRAVAFADQLNLVEAYRPEKRFADAVKGLHLYGAKIVYPKEMVLLNLTPA